MKQLSSYSSAFCLPACLLHDHLLSSTAGGKMSTATNVGGFPMSIMRTKQGFCPHFCGVTNVDSPHGSETVSALAIYCSPAKPYVFFINSVKGEAAYATEGVFS